MARQPISALWPFRLWLCCRGESTLCCFLTLAVRCSPTRGKVLSPGFGVRERRSSRLRTGGWRHPLEQYHDSGGAACGTQYATHAKQEVLAHPVAKSGMVDAAATFRHGLRPAKAHKWSARRWHKLSLVCCGTTDGCEFGSDLRRPRLVSAVDGLETRRWLAHERFALFLA